MTDRAPHWLGRAGAWVGIGASPAALILGAQLADRHGAPLALGGLAVAAIGMLILLIWQGQLGLVPPLGEGVTFGEVVVRYFDVGAARVISLVLAAAMVGWVGFNAGLGGAALAELIGIPHVAAVTIALGLGAILTVAGLRWWNWFALAATSASLLLMVVVVIVVEPDGAPVTLEVPAPGRFLTDVTALVGYVSVFALRSPDFTAGLQRRRDVVWSSVLLVAITLGVAAAGAAVWSASGERDVLVVIAERVSVGNLLLLFAVLPAMLTSLHSGRLSLAAGAGLPPRLAAIVVAFAGLVLGIARFDRALVSWLAVLSVVLVPIMIPLAREVLRRRRGARPGVVTTWVWAPASAVGAVAVLVGHHLALAMAAGLAALLTGGSALIASRSERSDESPQFPTRRNSCPD